MNAPSHTVLINRTVDLALLWSFCLLAASGLVMHYRLSSEYYLPTGATILGLTWKSWCRLHLLSGYITLGCVLLHLALHWRWIWQAAVQKRSRPIIFVLLVAIVLFSLPLFAPIRSP
jgi:cell division protein FtsW (lipid II flippase)